MPTGSKAANYILLQRQLQEAIPYRPIARLLSHLYTDFRLARIPKRHKYNIIRQYNHKAPQPAPDCNSRP